MYDYNIIKMKKKVWCVLSVLHPVVVIVENERSFVDSLSCLHKESFELCFNR